MKQAHSVSYSNDQMRKNGLGANYCMGDFGGAGMGDLWSDFTKFVSTTVDKTLSSAQTSLQKEATKTVQNFVMNLTGQGGQKTSITLTPEQKALYDQTGTLPPHLLPPGYLAPQRTFMDQYGQQLMIAGGVTLAVVLGVMIYKAVKK